MATESSPATEGTEATGSSATTAAEINGKFVSTLFLASFVLIKPSSLSTGNSNQKTNDPPATAQYQEMTITKTVMKNVALNLDGPVPLVAETLKLRQKKANGKTVGEVLSEQNSAN